MIVNKQKPLTFRNVCECIFSAWQLEQAILWQTQARPVCRLKTIFLNVRYPAISIYGTKLHVHRLLYSWFLKRPLLRTEYIHHKDGNKLNTCLSNLELIKESDHQSLHNKGKILTHEHRHKISEANKKRKGIKMAKRVNIPLYELSQLIRSGKSVNAMAKHFKCDWSTIKSRIYENPELLEGK